jgi:hypothetical protein
MGKLQVYVLENDDAGSAPIDPASVQVVVGSGHGDTVLGASGTVQYTPLPGYAGPDEFGYTVADINGVRSNVATVSLDVVKPVIPPTANDLGPFKVEGNID